MSLVSDVQQSDSVIHKHPSIFFKFFSHLGYYRILSRVFWAIYSRSLLVVNFKDSSVYTGIPNSQSIPPPTLVTIFIL